MSSQLTENFTIYSWLSGGAEHCYEAPVKHWRGLPVFLVAVLIAVPVKPQSVAPAGITQKTIGELETRQVDAAGVRYLLRPADRVVGGDRLVYTVEIRNTSTQAIEQVVAISPIPQRMSYVAESATGPGCDIDFSVDGGANFGIPSQLLILMPAGRSRPAVAADYTHIRWKFKYALSANASAYARFRAVLK